MIRTLLREAEKNGKEIIKKNYDLNCNIIVKHLANYSLLHLVRWEIYLLNLRLEHNNLQARYWKMCANSYYPHFDKVLPKVLLAELSVNILGTYILDFFLVGK